jgi:hypothetical protein
MVRVRVIVGKRVSHLCCYAGKKQVGDALGLEKVSQVCCIEGAFARLVQQLLPLRLSVQHCQLTEQSPQSSRVFVNTIFPDG